VLISPWAHVKWFVDPSRYPTDYSLLLSAPVIVAFVIALGAAGAARLVRRHVREPRIFASLERFAGFGPVALGIHVGLALMAAAALGMLFVPSLRVVPDAEGYALLAVEFAVGLALAVGFGTRVAALGLAVLGAVAMMPFSLESILEQVHLLGAAIYLFVIGRGAVSIDRLFGKRRSLEYEQAPQFSLFVLRVAMGFGIAYGALTEKLLDPALSAALLQQRPELNIVRALGVSDPQFVYLAGLSELLIGVVILSGQLTRPAMAAGALLFTITLPLFGWLELLGHLAYYGMMLTLLLTPDADPPRVRRQLRAGKLAA
jgi:uncharacterized membrane protein YphA (DoxX/SURF4 family)